MQKQIFYICSFCKNDWTIEEGFNLKTNQCHLCDTFDIEEPIRNAERDKSTKWREEQLPYIEAYLFMKHGK